MRIRKLCKKLTIALLTSIMLMSLGANLNCYAKEGEQGGVGVSVSYVKETNDKYLLYVSIIGQGSLYDGEATIRDQTNKYEIEIDAEKVFSIVPDKGYVLDKILLNKIDITNEVILGKIKILGKDYDQYLEVYYKKANIKDDTGNKGNDHKVIKTEDYTPIGLSIMALMISLLLILLIKRKKDEDE
ncbi:MAG: hypothetical protein ACLUVC_05375 [Longibaculum sp.]